jgi:chemotaxis protein MotB
MQDDFPEIRRSDSQQRRHRGGAWKVAYADFVTALMALFIVLWLMNSSKQVQQAISAYFRDPRSHVKLGTDPAGSGGNSNDSVSINKDNVEQLKQKLEQAIRTSPEFSAFQKQVEISITGEGLRVELLETEQGLFFDSGRPEPSRSGERMLALLAKELARLKNSLVIEGHTDARPYRYTGLNGYTNWELAVDRANAARRCLQDSGVHPDQVVQVRGFADKRLLKPADPFDSRNRRVSVVVEYEAPATMGTASRGNLTQSRKDAKAPVLR